jgi:hypothetical protein
LVCGIIIWVWVRPLLARTVSMQVWGSRHACCCGAQRWLASISAVIISRICGPKLRPHNILLHSEGERKSSASTAHDVPSHILKSRRRGGAFCRGAGAAPSAGSPRFQWHTPWRWSHSKRLDVTQDLLSRCREKAVGGTTWNYF